jgi:hypothetical protein
MVQFKFKIPAGEKSTLTFFDGNFAELNGAIRLAIKTSGRAMLLRSNAAPILLRADRVELGELDAKERQASCALSATIVVGESQN